MRAAVQVHLEEGTYIIGTPNPNLSPTINNQPLLLGSNIHIRGKGIGKTILQICDEANMLAPYLLNDPRRNQGCFFWTAGPIFINRGNTWWSTGATADMNQPYDTNIEIEGITFDGNKNHQSTVYEALYRPNETAIHDISEHYGINPSIFWEGVNDGGGKLPQGTYDAWVRWQDAQGNEGRMSWYGTYPIGPGNNAIKISLPPIYPEGAFAVVPYIRRADYSNSDSNVDSDANEVDQCGNGRYERQEPIPLTNIKWDGNPDKPNWPTVRILSHTHYPRGNINTQGNFRTPERVSLFGDAGASSTCYFYVAENVRVHDIEARNFALDGVMIARVRNCRFDKMHVHHNGRWGISVVTDYFQNVEFNDCVVELNESGGVDMEPPAGQGLRWNRCSFLNQGLSVGISLVGKSCEDLEFNACTFDGSYLFHLGVNNAGGTINNLKINDCVFKNNYRTCIAIYGNEIKDTTGEISGCTFEEANGRAPEYGPVYYYAAGDVSTIILEGSRTTFSIANNLFKPWFWYWTSNNGQQNYYSSSAAIEIDSTTGIGKAIIINNKFHSNPQDTRPATSLGDTWGQILKNQNFLFTTPQNASFCKIAGNIGDGFIWLDSTVEWDMTHVQ